MSKIDQLENPIPTVVSSVVTRSQSSRASFITAGLDAESQPRAGDSTLKKSEIKQKGAKRADSKLDMALFGDVDLGGEASSDSSSERSQGTDVSSVASNLQISCDDLKQKKQKASKIGSKVSSKPGSEGSLTKSELFRINMEIKKLELEGKNKKLELEGKRLKFMDKQEERKILDKQEERKIMILDKHEERKFKLKKLELGSKREGSKHGDKEAKHESKEELKGDCKEVKETEKPKFESSLLQEKFTINHTPLRAEVPRMYEVDFNLDNYLIVFERLAVAQGWSRDKWVSRLTTQFNAKCQDIFSRIPVDSCQDFEIVKQKLLEGYNLGPETYRKSFKLLERIQNENFKDFALKLQEVFSKWIKGINCDSFEQLKQILLLEKFYSSIPKELVALLKDKKVTSLDEASKLADLFDSYREKVFSNQGTIAAREYSQSKYPNLNQNNRESRFDSLRGSRPTTSNDARNSFSNNNSNYFHKGNEHKGFRSNSHNSFYGNRKPWHNNNDNSRVQKGWHLTVTMHRLTIQNKL